MLKKDYFYAFTAGNFVTGRLSRGQQGLSSAFYTKILARKFPIDFSRKLSRTFLWKRRDRYTTPQQNESEHDFLEVFVRLVRFVIRFDRLTSTDGVFKRNDTNNWVFKIHFILHK